MSNIDWEIVRNEINETKAHLFLTKLEQEGLNAVITNESMATMIPMHNSGYIIRVPTNEAARATAILQEYEQELEAPAENDFRDADMDDIEYEKSVQDHEDKISSAKSTQLWIYLIGLLLLIIAILFIMSKMKGG